MWFLRSMGLLVFTLYLGTGVSRAQQSVVVHLDTNMPKAVVYADTTLLGPASMGTFHIPAQTQRLRLVPVGETNWSITPVTTPLHAAAGDTLHFDLSFPYHYQIETVPYGASVSLENVEGSTALGETPVLYKSPQVLSGTLVIEKQGYLAQRIKPGDDIWNRYVLTLEPFHVDDVRSVEESWRPPRKRRRWIDYSLAAVALTAGAISVHYKFKADRINDDYLETGDPSLRPRIQRLDRRAGIALGVMQAGMGVLALRFVLR